MKYHINITRTGAKIAYSSLGGLSFLLNGRQTRQHAIKPGRRRVFGRRFSTFQITAREQQLIFGKNVAFVFIQRENPIMTVNEAKHDPYLGAVSNGRLFYVSCAKERRKVRLHSRLTWYFWLSFPSTKKKTRKKKREREKEEEEEEKESHPNVPRQVLIIWQNAD